MSTKECIAPSVKSSNTLVLHLLLEFTSCFRVFNSALSDATTKLLTSSDQLHLPESVQSHLLVLELLSSAEQSGRHPKQGS